MSKEDFLKTDWYEILKDEFQKSYMIELKKFLQCERESGYKIYPKNSLIFNAFMHTTYKDVKVVIMGQDPYHQPNQAHVLSFSVPNGIPIPVSLKNIFKEIESDLNIKMNNIGDLTHWAKQGVLLLNATLTVRDPSARSHYGKGWENFTDKVIEILKNKKEPIVFLLWGTSAKEKIEKFFKNNDHPHLILKAAHPSFFSVKGFFGCKHFSKANEFLKKNNNDQINWKIS